MSDHYAHHDAAVRALIDAARVEGRAEGLRDAVAAMPACQEPGAFCPCDALVAIVRRDGYRPLTTEAGL
jgi:hypothetical protein